MSLTLVETWVTGMLRHPRAALDVMNLFDESAAQGVEATLIVAQELTKTGKSYLARWTGEELVVLELSPSQQLGFGVVPGGLSHVMAARHAPPTLPGVRRVTLSGIKIDDANRYDGHRRLAGKAAFEMDDAASAAVFGCALRVQYFRPNMPRQITGFSHTNGPLVPPRGELKFAFDPLFGKDNPDQVQGPMVLFFQLMTARDWTNPLDGCQRISNVAASVVEIR